jgi:hypothetical protein
MSTSDKYNWSHLNRLQLGKYAEYLAKMEFVRCGCDVFTAEVDDHGIDFVVRTRHGKHYDIQVKSFRPQTGYVFLQKTKFSIHPSSLLVLVQFINGELPTLYLVRSCAENDSNCPNPMLKGRDYDPPEWGLTLSKKNLATLAEDCSFQAVVGSLE